MILDKLLEFSDAQAVTATGISTNQTDRGAQAVLDNRPSTSVPAKTCTLSCRWQPPSPG